MKKLTKRHIGQPCIVLWYDAWTDTSITLDDMLKQGFAIKNTIGRLAKYNRKLIILNTEKDNISEAGDYTMIPRGWVKEIRFLKD